MSSKPSATPRLKAISSVATEELIERAGRALIDAAPAPAKVIPFGSHARGDFQGDSDLDFLVIERQVEDLSPRPSALRSALRGFGAPVDVIVSWTRRLLSDAPRSGAQWSSARCARRAATRRAAIASTSFTRQAGGWPCKPSTPSAYASRSHDATTNSGTRSMTNSDRNHTRAANAVPRTSRAGMKRSGLLGVEVQARAVGRCIEGVLQYEHAVWGDRNQGCCVAGLNEDAACLLGGNPDDQATALGGPRSAGSAQKRGRQTVPEDVVCRRAEARRRGAWRLCDKAEEVVGGGYPEASMKPGSEPLGESPVDLMQRGTEGSPDRLWYTLRSRAEGAEVLELKRLRVGNRRWNIGTAAIGPAP
jgi:predicted nucleotidyltransferase